MYSNDGVGCDAGTVVAVAHSNSASSGLGSTLILMLISILISSSLGSESSAWGFVIPCVGLCNFSLGLVASSVVGGGRMMTL